MDRISELPKDILGRVLYFLPQEQAVRTSVLSKSWLYIWCTRPNLDFSLDTFKGNNKQEFLSVVDKTLQRYCDRQLGVEEFGLCMPLADSDQQFVSLLEKWIMGVKKFRLSIRSVIQFERRAELPSVVFGAESLQDLHVQGFVLDGKAIQRIVIFKHLKSLRLREVSIEDDIFQKIISCCPLIETMDLQQCERLNTIKVDDLHNLKKFSFLDSINGRCSIELYARSLETISIYNKNLRFHQGADFRNLNHLSLCDVGSSLEHLSSYKFPSLRHLSLSGCAGLKDSHLFIDAPNILYFRCAQDFVPSISFATTSKEWKSRLYLTYRHPNDAPSSWFLKLNELLKSLSSSKISLSINDEVNIDLVLDNGCDKPAVVPVETLTLHCHLSHISSLLNTAFCVCRPRNMNGYLSGNDIFQRERKCIERLWEILMERESEDQLHQFRQLWERDLVEVSFEIKERTRGEWRTTDLTNPRETGHVRFAFQWREDYMW